jgi:hypothetical protein
MRTLVPACLGRCGSDRLRIVYARFRDAFRSVSFIRVRTSH